MNDARKLLTKQNEEKGIWSSTLFPFVLCSSVVLPCTDYLKI